MSSYRRILKLLQKWPVDTSKKGGRDLGEHLRSRVTNAFKQGETTPVNETECERVYLSLERLASDFHRNKYPRTQQSSALGLTLEQYQEINSTEFIERVNQEEAPLYDKLFKRT